jgi:hypothetical protein
MFQSIRRWLTHPAVLFALCWAALLALFFLPLLRGGVLLNPMSDGKDGYTTRHFAATVIHLWGEVPRWNPYIFGGLPFLGAMHGDQVYPFSVALRALFTPALGIGLGMVFHLWVGAVGLLVFLRLQRLSWTAAVIGATAYGIGGPFIGLFFPGHDGKIYVLGLLPWALAAILQASRSARPAAFAAWGALLGLMLLSPHFQMAYYSALLMGAYLLLCLVTETPPTMRWRVIAGMVVASGLGLMFAGAQLMPYFEYLPFSPRSAAGSTSTGWEYATSWAMPAPELIGTLWGGFNGWHATYWGSNPFKLHSDYLGLLTGVLAVTAILRRPTGPERRKTWFWVGAVIFGTLWVLGAQTPFYRLPYTLLPAISKTRAPGMMWGQVSLCVAVLAAMGVARIEAMETADRRRWAVRVAGAVGATALLLAAASGSLLTSLAPTERFDAALAAVDGARWGILLGAVSVIVFVLVARQAPRWIGAAGVAMLLLDLGVQAQRFIVIDPAGDQVFAADGAVQAMEKDAAGTTQPWRVLPLGPYMNDYLIEHRIRSVLGYHGNELHTYDETLGGKGRWSALSDSHTWRLLAVRYVITGQAMAPSELVPIASGVRTWLGDSAWVYRVPDPAPWAVVAPLAFKAGNEEQVRATVISPQFDPARIALVPKDAQFGTTTLPTALPDALLPAPAIRVTEKQPGVYRLAIDGLERDGVLVVSENWLPSWVATVDGRAAPVARANGTFIAIPVAAHSKDVLLSFEPRGDRRGLELSFIGLTGILLLALLSLVRRPSPPASQRA